MVTTVFEEVNTQKLHEGCWGVRPCKRRTVARTRAALMYHARPCCVKEKVAEFSCRGLGLRGHESRFAFPTATGGVEYRAPFSPRPGDRPCRRPHRSSSSTPSA